MRNRGASVAVSPMGNGLRNPQSRRLPPALLPMPEMRFLNRTFDRSDSIISDVTRMGRKPIRFKSDGSLLSSLDSALDELWRTSIRTEYPSDGLLSEESSSLRSTRRVWIIDPLDGTTNWSAGLPIYAISVGLAINGEIEFAGIYLPALGLTYYAARGHGAYCGEDRINVRQTKVLQFSSVVTMCSWRSNDVGLLRLQANVRAFGCTAYHLALLAAGVTDGAIECGCRVWDYAAGLLLVREAGGVSFESEPLGELLDPRRSREIVPVFAAVNDKVLQLLRSSSQGIVSRRRTLL